ncbi:LysR family transcriptional regulator [Aliivibrio fischeri]|uniref:LysR family transcriptional regulator n=1 Tax=Aliivibrio fischeri TaxID=668 RepID=UPI0012D96C98|nr:LysR family transcriptional regulator [Aliivibrio fischeri]MUK62333.1 LysR family transcriptional regulator [Aliivibrio fischeri]MUL21397.1 LysR family transcriptional regulator [Aliivibrio fischeri]MUL23580.1 LysR family transcriptional regulator [Aliivibrio fischeri]
MKTLEQELSRVDLNLLVSLSVLIKEKNVSRAAEKLYLSQPAMSRILGRLRELFDDPLFYRESNGLQPTAKILELESQLDNLLFSIDSLIKSSNFSAKTCEKAFRLSTPPLMSKLLTAPLAKAIHDIAPKVTLEEYPSAIDPILLLKEGHVDFSIHIEDIVTSDEYRSEKIGYTYPVIYGASDHPLLKKENITIDDCLEYSFVELSLDIRSTGEYLNPIDVELRKQGKCRSIALKSGQLSTLIESIKGTDRLIIGGHLLGQDPILGSSFKAIKTFDSKPYTVGIYLIEHKRTLTSSPHRWLKLMISESIKKSFQD